MRRSRSRAQARLFCGLTLVSAALAILGSTASASAEETKRACAEAAERGQRLRDEGKPLAARADLVMCSRSACPTVVRAHCARWLERIDDAIPTIVIRAHAGPRGREVDVTDVAVTIDGIPALQALDGQPRRIEPGDHTFLYTRAGAPAPIEARVLLVAGEKNRLLTVDFVDETNETRTRAPSASGGAGPESTGAGSGTTEIRPAAWVFAGLAVVGGASFAYFGATGKSDLDSLRATCAGHCAQSSVSSAWDRLIVADASLAIGVVSAAIATWLFATPRHLEPPPAATGLLVGPSLNGSGLSVGWRGAF